MSLTSPIGSLLKTISDHMIIELFSHLLHYCLKSMGLHVCVLFIKHPFRCLLHIRGLAVSRVHEQSLPCSVFGVILQMGAVRGEGLTKVNAVMGLHAGSEGNQS